jgi:hypothetical protein
MEPATLNLQERPRMLVDVYIAFRVVKEALRRISGVPTGTSVLTTMFGIGVLATAIHRIASPALRAFRPRHPSVAGTAIAAAVLRDAPGGIAGVRGRDTRYGRTAITMALVAPALRRIDAPERMARAALRRRYRR